MEFNAQKNIVILGNGQLGLMLGKAAKKLGISLEALSIPDAWTWLDSCLSSEAQQNTLVTFEQEHVDEALLAAIQKLGIESFPSWNSFLLLRSKLSQKLFLQENAIPSSPFLPLPGGWSKDADAFVHKHAGAVLKAGKGGYDGKGVWLVNEAGNTKDGPAKELAPKLKEAYLETRAPFVRELAAVVCRSRAGEIQNYPTVVSVQRDGICSEVEYTKEFAATKTAKQAGSIAAEIARKLDYVGVLAVELFELASGELLVNEIAPRVHNSGHFTIDVCDGSQFENHLRAGFGLPLAKTEPTHPAALMVNLLWPATEKEFAPLYARLSCGPEWPENVKLHWYGKSEVRPNRKMGHFTVYGASLAECRKSAQQILASRWA